MDYKEFIKEECQDIYIKQRDNLADRIIEAKYNLQFLKMVYERNELYHQNHDVTERFEIGVILRRIYVTVAWELALQIKAFTDDTASDTLTVSKLQKKMPETLKSERECSLWKAICFPAKFFAKKMENYRRDMICLFQIHHIFQRLKLKN